MSLNSVYTINIKACSGLPSEFCPSLMTAKKLKDRNFFVLKSRRYWGDFRESWYDDSSSSSCFAYVDFSTKRYLSDSGSSAGPKVRIDLGLSSREWSVKWIWFRSLITSISYLASKLSIAALFLFLFTKEQLPNLSLPCLPGYCVYVSALHVFVQSVPFCCQLLAIFYVTIPCCL